ncbi:uncharacterized protein LOC125067275 [Vanessa atalanta]|uniref:uncharacterized protein LOC125067275 n=1 Tax=Vanessa atalanta TaxID=42275 RepID=UPI001FCDB4F4|nr:uncharacterized protein LOC125067275 [Vanessa atalanta]
MKTSISLFMLIFGSALGDLAGECDLAGYYMELGCTALPKADNTTICPEAFLCPDLHPNPNMCYYRGTPYADRSMIPQNLINNPCSQACSCSVTAGPQFDCAAVDCVETFDSDMQQECINTYELDSCCSTGTVCGKDAIASLKTCEVDGQTYKEGQPFEPANTRKSCICTAQWNGSYDDPSSCRDINCGLEIHYQDKIFENCAPVFIGNMKSCPIAFQCPNDTSKVIRGLNLKSVNAQCSFGNMTLSVGDEVTVDEKCTKCSCDKPPFVSCVRKNSCDE